MRPKFDRSTFDGSATIAREIPPRGTERAWWDEFYRDRAKPCPFFGTAPDESLAQWIDEGLIQPGRAVDFGCGNGRNAILLAERGFAVEGLDYSSMAIDWARERARDAGVEITFNCQSVFDAKLEPGAYDLVYDSGCFHHIPPRWRQRYVDRVAGALRPGGSFGLACFTPEGGSGLTDSEVYEQCSMGGGLGYTTERLMQIWSDHLEIRAIRPMRRMEPDSGLFGEDCLWVVLATRH